MCPPGFEEAQPVTPTADRVLASCTLGLTYKPESSCTAACKPLQDCTPENEYESTPPTLSSDRACTPLTECATGTYEARVPTPTDTPVSVSRGTYEPPHASATSERLQVIERGEVATAAFPMMLEPGRMLLEQESEPG